MCDTRRPGRCNCVEIITLLSHCHKQLTARNYSETVKRSSFSSIRNRSVRPSMWCCEDFKRTPEFFQAPSRIEAAGWGILETLRAIYVDVMELRKAVCLRMSTRARRYQLVLLSRASCRTLRYSGAPGCSSAQTSRSNYHLLPKVKTDDIEDPVLCHSDQGECGLR